MSDIDEPREITREEWVAEVGEFWADKLMTVSALDQLVFLELIGTGAKCKDAWVAMVESR